jgi:hypothetical protein
VIHLTFDQDWAPAWATLAVHEQMQRHGFEGTFFVTHACPALAELRRSVLWELGWHPNFLAGSSHGPSPAEVLDTMVGLVPEARGVRAHCLVRSTVLWQAYVGRGLVYEASDLLDGMAGLHPLVAWNGLVRLPIYFEDDVHLQHGRALTLEALGLERPGMKCFNFHPILLSLNAADLQGYGRLKQHLSEQHRTLSEATPAEVAAFRNQEGPGMADLLALLLDWLGGHRGMAGGRLAPVADQARQAAGWRPA